MKKSNLEIVVRYLTVFEGERSILFPDNYRYGLMKGDLHLVLMFSEYMGAGVWEDGEETWHSSDISFTYFSRQCTLLDEAVIIDLVFQLSRTF